MRSVTIYVDDTVFYAKFLANALIDQFAKPTTVSQLGSDIVLTLPHFWDYAAIDPGMREEGSGFE